MKKALLLGAAMFALATPAFAANDEITATNKAESKSVQRPDGSVEKRDNMETSSKDASGTEIHEKTSVNVDTDANGNRQKETKVIRTVDPKGLFNEKKTEKVIKEQVKDGSLTTQTTEKVDGKTTVDVKEEKPASANQ